MRFRLVGRNDRILEMNVRVLFLGPQAGMTGLAYHRLDRRQESFTLSFSTHDQVENDTKVPKRHLKGVVLICRSHLNVI